MNARSIMIAAAAVLLSSTAVLADPVSAKASAGDGSFIAATLAPYGSFEFVVAPSYTTLALVRRNTAVALRNHTIKLAKAEQLQKRADEVRALLDKASAACRQNNRTGTCTKSQRQANVFLNEANAKLAALK